MNSLPATSPEHYLTGTSAMTIPSGGAAFVDWHFVDTFLDRRASFRIAGRNFPDTSHLFGRLGVYECADILRRNGVALSPDDTFYAADRDRAVLDMIAGNLQLGRRPDHIRLADHSDNEAEAGQLKEKISQMRELLSDERQAKLLDEWLMLQ
ncbi:MAG TPA: hypothetical protein DDZ88_24135 [Verrucomicrobiales bacterium]|nr:hypothetical protein [Verrucomicrobiales bacterium]